MIFSVKLWCFACHLTAKPSMTSSDSLSQLCLPCDECRAGFLTMTKQWLEPAQAEQTMRQQTDWLPIIHRHRHSRAKKGAPPHIKDQDWRRFELIESSLSVMTLDLISTLSSSPMSTVRHTNPWTLQRILWSSLWVRRTVISGLVALHAQRKQGSFQKGSL